MRPTHTSLRTTRRTLFCAAVLPVLVSTPALAQRNYALENGLWFDGAGFVHRTLYSVNGRFAESRPATVDSTIDLAGRFVVPPYADAHNHDLADTNQLADKIKRHLARGVFYKKNLHYVQSLTVPILARMNTPSSIDMSYAHGGLTAPGGHAVDLYTNLVRSGVFPGWTVADLDTRAYFIIGNERDLEQKWPAILAGKPDFIKTYLEYSEEYEKRRNDTAYFGHRGLDPALLPRIVARAHAAGLRVSAHIETRADFHAALVSGVDEIAHLPGYQLLAGVPVSRYEITDQDAALAADRGVVVVTTTSLSNTFHARDTALRALAGANHVRNIALLKKHGVRVAIGSDTWGDTSVGEIANLLRLGAFTPLELLKAWCEVTPQTIFPQRRIGRLAPGYEASFVALTGNPLEDFANTGRIALLFKQGRPLHVR